MQSVWMDGVCQLLERVCIRSNQIMKRKKRESAFKRLLLLLDSVCGLDWIGLQWIPHVGAGGSMRKFFFCFQKNQTKKPIKLETKRSYTKQTAQNHPKNSFFNYGHTQKKVPDPVRSPKSNFWWHCQYCGRRRRGNTVCCSFLFFSFFLFFYFFQIEYNRFIVLDYTLIQLGMRRLKYWMVNKVWLVAAKKKTWIFFVFLGWWSPAKTTKTNVLLTLAWIRDG